MKPAFSVILTTYRRDFRPALRSVLAQHAAPHEIILVDDDPQSQIAHWLVEVDPHNQVRYVRNAANLGAAASRNVGLALATGDYVVFHDDDDLMRPHKLERLADCVTGDLPDLIAHGACVHLTNERVSYQTRPCAAGNAAALFVANTLGGACCVAVRRCSCRAVGGFDVQLRADEDYALWMRMTEQGYGKAIVLTEPLVDVYVASQTDSVSKNQQQRMATFELMRERYPLLYRDLSLRQRRQRLAYFNDSLAYAALLAGGRGALGFYWRAFCAGKRTALLKLALAALSPRLLFRIRGWL